jgi:hypothetical protein
MHTEGCFSLTEGEGSHYRCQCPCHGPMEAVPNTVVIFDVADSDISNPPDWTQEKEDWAVDHGISYLGY